MGRCLLSSTGEVVQVTSRVIFNSEKTVEVECVVDVSNPFQGQESKTRCIEAYFSFVTINKKQKPQPMVPLKVSWKKNLAQKCHCVTRNLVWSFCTKIWKQTDNMWRTLTKLGYSRQDIFLKWSFLGGKSHKHTETPYELTATETLMWSVVT